MTARAMMPPMKRKATTGKAKKPGATASGQRTVVAWKPLEISQDATVRIKIPDGLPTGRYIIDVDVVMGQKGLRARNRIRK